MKLMLLTILPIILSGKVYADGNTAVRYDEPLAARSDSAKTSDALPSLHPMGNYPEMIMANVTEKPKLNFDNWQRSNTTAADFGNLNAKDGKIKMIAFGGGLTAGVSNGGLYREGQQAAYPNLVAKQMGLVDFKSPLFETDEFNGTGYYVYANKGAQFPRWNKIANNLASVTPGTPPAFRLVEGQSTNYAFPNGASTGLMYPYCGTCGARQTYINRITSYKARNGHFVLDEIKEKQPYTFAIVEDFFDRWINGVQTISQFSGNDQSFNGSIFNSGRITDYSINSILDQGQNGVIFTIPDYKDLPFMNWYSVSELRDKAAEIKIHYRRNNELIELDTNREFLLVPTPSVARIFENLSSGGSVVADLEDVEVIDSQEISLSDPALVYNQKIKEFAKSKNLAVVDLYQIYKSVTAGKYISDDGYVVDGSTYGDFFSSDGIYPTAIGQAIIANEVIKSVNATYQAKIPLISITTYAKSIGFQK